jgi:hypothetical protein
VSVISTRRDAQPAEAGELLDILALDMTGVFVTGEGALVRIVEVTTRDPRPMGSEERARVARGFEKMLGRLRGGQSLQFYVQATPVQLPEVLARKREKVKAAVAREPWQRRDALLSLAEAHEQTLIAHASEDAAVDLRAFVVIPFRPRTRAKVDWKALRQAALEKRRGLPLAPLTRGLAEHHKTVRDLEAHTDNIVGDLKSLGMVAHRLDGREVSELLYQRFNPSSQGSGYMPRLEITGSLDEQNDPAAAALAAHELRERIAGSSIDLDDSRFLRVENDLEQVVYVSRTADATRFGWLFSVMSINRPFALSVHVHALDRYKERQKVVRTRARVNGVIRGTEQRGKIPDERMEGKLAEAGALLDELRDSNRTTLTKVSVYMSVRQPGPDPDRGALAEASERAIAAVRDETDANATAGGFIQKGLWQSTLPLGRDVAQRTRRYVTRHAGHTVPLVGPSCGSPGGFPFAFAAGVRSIENLDPWDRMIPNGLMVINGRQGSGKTMAGITIAARLLPLGVNVTVLDRSNHWEMLTRLVPGAAHLSIGAPDAEATICPWDVDDPSRSPPDDKITFLRDLHELLIGNRRGSGPGELDEHERNLLSIAIRGVYGRCLREGRRPLERDLAVELEGMMRADRDAAGAITNRSEVLENLKDRLARYVGDGEDAHIADRPSTVPDDARMLVFDLRRARGQLAAVMFVALEHTERKVERRRLEREAANVDGWWLRDALMSDETWAYMQHRVTGEFFNNMSRRSRHLGLLNCASTQHLHDLDNEHGRAMLRSAYRMLFFEQSEDELRAVQETLRLSDNEVRLISELTTEPGRQSEAFWINGKRGRGVVQFPLGDLEYWLATSDPINDVPRRNAALVRHHGDAWAALRELAKEGR